MTDDKPLSPDSRRVWEEQFSSAQRALAELQDILSWASDDDWRASLVWEAVERAQEVLGEGMFDALEAPSKPPDFKHWREKYAKPEDVF